MSRPRRTAAAEPAMFPHTVTLYNVSVETDKESFTSRTVSHITILRGVLLDACKAVNVRESGLVGADSAMLYIPHGVKAADGITGKPKKYVPPVEFWRMEDKSAAWTLSVSSKNPDVDGNTFFVKGIAVEPERDTQFIEMLYDHVYDITSVDDKDFGGLAHFEIGAK